MNELEIKMRIRKMSVNEMRDYILESVQLFEKTIEDQRHTRDELHLLEKWKFRGIAHDSKEQAQSSMLSGCNRTRIVKFREVLEDESEAS